MMEMLARLGAIALEQFRGWGHAAFFFLDLLRATQSARGLAVLFISHDLAVVSGIADRIAVMYAGRIVEEGPASDVIADPLHPYTRGLLASRPGGSPGSRLLAIPGVVPDMAAPPPR